MTDGQDLDLAYDVDTQSQVPRHGLKPQHLAYSLEGHPLQTLDLWPPSDFVPGTDTVLFVIYLHGGAWTDPEQDAREGHTLLEHFNRLGDIDGVKLACASVNYRLSTENAGVKHPMHMNDVVEALRYLQTHHGMRKCVLIGHSAGATLAVQVCLQFHAEISALILFNGIYDLRTLVKEYPSYEGFVTAAFGDSAPESESPGKILTKLEAWDKASPSSIINHADFSLDREDFLIVLAHSEEDELLSMRQTDSFYAGLQKKRGCCPIRKVRIHGKHDDSPCSEEMQQIAFVTVAQTAELLIHKDMEKEPGQLLRNPRNIEYEKFWASRSF